MKRKIFSILFALVLVVSFSLVTAVPTAAEDPPNPTFATVSMPSFTTPSNKITIGWERNPAITGGAYSGTDAIHVTTTSKATLDYAMVIVPTEFAFSSAIPISYWGYTVSGNVKAPDEIFLFLDTGDDGAFDTLLTSHKPGPDASLWYGSWHEWNSTDITEPLNDWHIVDPTTGYTEVQLADYIDKGYTVLAIALTAGPSTAGTAVNIDVYFDQLTVDGEVVLDEDTGFIDVPLPLGDFPPPSIQDAIDAALPGDTITVAAGTYYEYIRIDKPLTVRSTDGVEETIIDGIAFRYMVEIYSSDVTFEGFTVTNPTSVVTADATGILVGAYLGESVSNVHILNNIVTQVRSETGNPSMYGATGINIGCAKSQGFTLSDVVISGNTITNIKNPDGASIDHTCGINVWDGAENVEISNNTISDIKYNGILLQRASNVLIEDNPMITECETGIRVEPFEEGAVSGLVIEDNILDGNHDGIVVVMGESLAILGNTITDFTKGGIVVKDVLSVQIEGNIISTTDYSVAPNGIQIGGLVDGVPVSTGMTGTVNDNQISGCHWSGYVPEETYDGEDNWTGSGILVIDTASQLTISGNEVRGCDVGMDIESGTPTTITNNDVYDNSYGFVLWNANPTINYNNIYQNDLCGVYRTIWGDLAGTVDVTNNYWGNASGPIPSGTYDSYGDKVSADVDFEPWLLAEVIPDVPPPTFDKTLALKDGWTLVSTDKAVADSAWVGNVLALKYTTAFVDAFLADLAPLTAIYVKTEGGGGVGINYVADGPVIYSKDLEAGWNLISTISSAIPTNALLSQLRHTTVGTQQWVGLTTLVSQEDYNQFSDDFYLATLTDADWDALVQKTLEPFDGYWAYMEAAETFEVMP